MSTPPPSPTEPLSSAQRLLVALKEARQKLEEAERARREPIAIIGMGCRFPGGASSPAAFWELLLKGHDAICEVPKERWDVEAYYDPDPQATGKTYTRSAGFLTTPVDGFDPHFFGISPREALSLDPQQRLLLEVSWEALEHAGQSPTELAGTRAGVFIGIGHDDYLKLIAPGGFLSEDIGIYGGTGNGYPFASGRISYLLGLHGPNIALDTACSSSLVALHLALASLRAKECELALVGAVQLMLSPAATTSLSRLGALSPDGRSKAFDAAADGFGRGEGCGVIVLKRLSDAIAAGDNICAVVRGSAVNHDGHSSGLTVPSEQAQAELIRQALHSAHLQPDAVHYLEAHGTGTTLGDPIELGALGSVFGRQRPHPLIVGSVKANLGHLEAAAGMASLIKTVLALQHNQIPPQLHFKTPNPHADWASLSVTIPTRPTPWPVQGDARRAGISSFGMGGTNAHVLLSAAPSPPPKPATTAAEPPPRPCQLLTLSAKTEPALRALASAYQASLATTTEDLADICFTANTGRAHFTHRLAVVGASPAELRDGLSAFMQGDERSSVVYGQVPRAQQRPKLAFLFTGQGAQYVNMGRELYQTEPVFRQTIDRCDELFQKESGTSLYSVLYPGPEQNRTLIDQTAYTQPALFALEYALAQLWLGWGLQPDYVMGHSVGEYVAACVAGVFSLEAGLALIAARGRLMQALPENGEMLAVMGTAAQVEPILQKENGSRDRAARVEIAAFNGPLNVVLAGAREGVRAVARQLESQGLRSRALTVSHAFHSPLMEPMLAEFAATARTVTYAAPQLPVVSNITGELAAADIATPDYWVRHVRQPVQFTASIATLKQVGVTCFVELGPKPTLLGLAKECLDSGVYLPSLRQERPDREQLLASLAALYGQGFPIRWQQLYHGQRRRKVPLPTYPFQRERYWVDERSAPAAPVPHKTAPPRPGHPLLGERQLSAHRPRERVFVAHLRAAAPEYLADHRVLGQVIVPASVYIEMALAAGRSCFASKPQRDPQRATQLTIEQLTIPQALVLPAGEQLVVQLVLSPAEEDPLSFRFQIFSLVAPGDDAAADPVWTLHASGHLTERPPPAALKPSDELPAACSFDAPRRPLMEHYQKLRTRGLEYGPAFQVVHEIVSGAQGVWGQVCLPEALAAQDYVLHPVLLDGCFQLVAALTPDDAATYLPIAYEQIAVQRSPQGPVWAHVTAQSSAGRSDELRFSLSVFDAAGPSAVVTGLTIRRVGQTPARPPWRDWLYELAFRAQPIFLPPDSLPAPAEIAAAAASASPAIMPQAALDEAEALIHQLERAGADYILSALGQLGWRLPVGHQITTAEAASAERSISVAQLGERLGIASRHRHLWGRLLAILTEMGYLRRTKEGWSVLQALAAPPTPDPAVRSDAEFVLLDRCGKNLAAVLQGQVDPLQLLFPDGDLSTTAAIYQHSGMARLANTLAQRVVQAALRSLAAERGVRILEIGAGTGGTTAYILPHLAPHKTQYVFTDISPRFLSQAQEKFGAYGFLQYQTLDIERDPLAQGLTRSGYDLIVASNVLHATRDLRQTLAHVQQLLAPGGLLVMVEATERRCWVDLTFGLTDGWWRFTDRSLRPDHPLLTPAQWSELLRAAGFAQAQTITPSATLSQTVIIGQAAQLREALARPWVIFADEGGLGEKLARRLLDQGERPTLVYRTGETPARRRDAIPKVDSYVIDPEAADAFKSVTGTPWHGVVYLWSLDEAARASELDEKIEAHSQRLISPVLQLVQALIKAQRSSRLWLVTQGAVTCTASESVTPSRSCGGLVQAELWGLGKIISLEHPELSCTCVDLDPATDRAEGDAQLFVELWHRSAEQQVALRESERLVARLAEAADTLGQAPIQLAITTEAARRGSLDGLELRSLNRRPPAAGEVELRVRAAGLNFRDVLNALGLYGSSPPLGGECAGEVVAVGEGVTALSPGDAVVALALGSFAEYVTVDARLVAPADGLTFAEAATIPTAFLTAALCLQHYAKLRRGERVLIHAGAGGVGQAAIQLAQQCGAEVFVTASRGKWEALQALGVQHIYDSRSLDFAAAIIADTEHTPRGRGVDVVLNSLTGAGFIEKSLSVLAPGGRFVEIAQRDIWSPERVTAARPDISYSVVNAAQLIAEQPESMGALLRALMQQATSGSIRPLANKAYPIAHAEQAFRAMQQARHIGKLVLIPPNRLAAPTLVADASYLITGGLGGLGLLVARWLVERGARHIVLVARSVPDAQAQAKIAELTALGATVIVEQADVAQRASMAALIARLARPLRGVIHAAGVLDDGVLRRQSWPRFAKVLAPKVQGAWHLHTLTQALPLDFFLLFSSAAALIGNAGQANHASANAFMDALAHYRQQQGLPACSINWGAWSEVGAAAQLMSLLKRLEGVITPAQGLDSLRWILTSAAAQVAVVPLDRKKRAQEGLFFREIAPADKIEQTQFLAQLTAAGPRERRALLEAHVCSTVAKVLGIRGAVPLDDGFFELGMDSLTSVELRNRLQKSLDCELPSSLTFDYPTARALVDYLSHQVFGSTMIQTEPEPRPAAVPDPDSATDDLTADEIAQRLAETLGMELSAHE